MPHLIPTMGGLVSPHGISYDRLQRVTLGLHTGQVYLLIIHNLADFAGSI